MESDTTIEPLSLTDKLNRETRAIHARTHHLIALKLVAALTDPRIYRQPLRDFYFLFRIIEEEWRTRMKTCAVLKEAYIEDLMNRRKAFERDLRAYYGRGWKDVKITPRMLDYTNHVRYIGAYSPELLLAYGFTMYGALISGGQTIRSKVLARKLFPSNGTNIFVFQDAQGAEIDTKVLRQQLHDKFNRLELSEEVRERLVEEAKEIFRRNIEVVEDISGVEYSVARWVLLAVLLVVLLRLGWKAVGYVL
ncbi:uncharacterized protein VTP21DRAFT_8006 [Calcarisporiella thermophila]|uniref:uncharacterized protein n=1 Tax=Calcarisporiella thermophila TaxID=911321 RepID=UPI003742421E